MLTMLAVVKTEEQEMDKDQLKDNYPMGKQQIGLVFNNQSKIIGRIFRDGDYCKRMSCRCP